MNDKPVTTSKKLAYSTLFNVSTLVINSVIQFFLVRFFLGQLGEERYGIWLLIGSIFYYRNLLGMGLNSAINRYIPVYLVKQNEEGIQQVISTALAFFSTLGLVLVVVTIVIYFNIGSWFAIAPELVNAAGRLVLIIGLSATFAMPLQLSSAILSGFQRYDLMNIGVLIPLFMRTVLLVVLLSHDYGLVTMGLIFGLSEIAMRLLQLTFALKLLPQVSISLAHVNFKLFREMLAYGINTFLYSTGAMIMHKASDVIIGIFIGTEGIAYFGIPMLVVLLLAQFLQTFSQALKPAVSDLDARDEHSRVREIAFLMRKYSLLLIVPAGCFLILMGKQFLWIWVGDKFQDPAVIHFMSTILVILTLGHCLRLAQHSNFLVLVGKGEHKVFGILMIITAVSCVTLSVLSIEVLKLGLIGIAWSNFLPLAVTSGLILPIYFNWKMRITVKESIIHVWLPVLFGTSPTVLLIIIWRVLAPPDGWTEIFAVVVVSMIITLASSWVLSFSDIERRRFLKILIPVRSK